MRSSGPVYLMAFAGAIIGVAGMAVLPPEVLSGELVRLLIVCGCLFCALLLTYRRMRRLERQRLGFHLFLVLWFFLLCSEGFFPRANNGEDNAYAGKFSITAYSEALFWIVLALCLVFVATRHRRILMKTFGDRRFLLLLLAGISLASVLWAPETFFSLAWSFKLALGVVIIGLCTASLNGLRDVRLLLIVTFWAFAFLTVVPVIEGTLNPASAFGGTSFGAEQVVEQGRFHATAHPLVIAGRAGVLAFLSLLFYFLERKKRMLVLASGCAVLIALAGAKTAFAAAVIAVALLFSLLRRIRTGFALVTALGALALLIVSTTAVGDYVRDYFQKGELTTISGRTDLWAAAWPEIVSHLAFGHGYVASKLVSMEVGIPWYAGHMHNAFLESLYNNGLAGLAVVVIINLLIATNLVRICLKPARPEFRLLAICLISLYAFILLNSFTEPYFGGQASAFYLMFLLLFGLADWLHAQNEQTFQAQLSFQPKAARHAISVARM